MTAAPQLLAAVGYFVEGLGRSELRSGIAARASSVSRNGWSGWRAEGRRQGAAQAMSDADCSAISARAAREPCRRQCCLAMVSCPGAGRRAVESLASCLARYGVSRVDLRHWVLGHHGGRAASQAPAGRAAAAASRLQGGPALHGCGQNRDPTPTPRPIRGADHHKIDCLSSDLLVREELQRRPSSPMTMASWPAQARARAQVYVR